MFALGRDAIYMENKARVTLPQGTGQDLHKLILD